MRLVHARVVHNAKRLNDVTYWPQECCQTHLVYHHEGVQIYPLDPAVHLAYHFPLRQLSLYKDTNLKLT